MTMTNVNVNKQVFGICGTESQSKCYSERCNREFTFLHNSVKGFFSLYTGVHQWDEKEGATSQ